jgi:YVTN family beta-propeller protein
MLTHVRAGVSALLVGGGLFLAASAPAMAESMLVGIDSKVFWDETGKAVFSAPGKDSVEIVDISSPMNPKIVASLPLMNSIFGPPTNLAITPDGSLAVVANSMDWVKDGENWKPAPDDRLYVIDLKSSPPKLIDTVKVGKQPSGMAINKAGNLLLIANRADKSISVLTIKGKEVKMADTVPMEDQVASVAITPDGKRALVTKFPSHKISVLDIDGTKVTYNKVDMPVGLWPYNIQITPNGKLGITADNGNSGAADGHVDTVSVIDMETNPVRVIDRVVVGDAPEGLAISPTGEYVAAVLLMGNNANKNAWFYHRNGVVALLKIDGKKLTKVADIEVRGLPEGAVFSADGKTLYVGNYMDDDVSILQLDGGKWKNTGKALKLPGHPASMRGVSP